MEFLDEGNTCKNKYDAHNQGSQNSPEQYFVLIFRWYLEIGEYHDEYKNVVYTQCLFNQIAGKKFECLLLSFPEIEYSVKNKRKHYPDNGPGKRFISADLMRFAVKNTQIQCQHDKDKNIKQYPE